MPFERESVDLGMWSYFGSRHRAIEHYTYKTTIYRGNLELMFRHGKVSKSRWHQAFIEPEFEFKALVDAIDIEAPAALQDGVDLIDWIQTSMKGTCSYTLSKCSIPRAFTTQEFKVKFSSEVDAALFRMMFDVTPTKVED